jgi:hypothetical protein
MAGLERMPDGPQLGIMARPHFSGGGLVGRQGPTLYKYLDNARRQGVAAIVFSPLDVDPGTGTLRGYMLLNGPDQPAVAPVANVRIPPVIYDQIDSRTFERRPDVSAVCDYLRGASALWNGGYFDKWQMDQWLRGDRRLRLHLPCTRLLSSARTLHWFAHRHDVLWIKPVDGSQGLGIVRIDRLPAGWRAVRMRRSGGNLSWTAADASCLWRQLRKRVTQRPHIIQQGVPLFCVDGRPLDVRAIMQRAEGWEWKRTKLFIRVAAPGSAVANLAQGGVALPLARLSDCLGAREYSVAQRQIRRLCQWVPEVVASHCAETVGELGIDLGVTATGHVYIIEVNSKPWKAPEAEHGSQRVADLAFIRPIAFARHLLRAGSGGRVRS